MANIVINTQYKAPSFQEMLAPLSMYTQEYNAIEEGLSDLSSKSNIWDKLADEQNSPDAYNMYKKYSDDLKKSAETLSTQRLNRGSKRQLLDMKNRYSSEIIPIEQAYQKRENASKYAADINLKDNTAIINPNTISTSLDDYLKNPNLTPEYVSGATLARQSAEQANNLAKELQENPQKIEKLYPGYLQLVKQRGYDRESIRKAVAGDPDADPILTGIVDRVMETSGLKDWGEEYYNKGKEYAKSGLWEAVGTKESQLMDDWIYKMNYQERLRSLKENKEKKEKEVNVAFGTIDKFTGSEKSAKVNSIIERTAAQIEKLNKPSSSDTSLYEQYMSPKTFSLMKEHQKSYNIKDNSYVNPIKQYESREDILKEAKNNPNIKKEKILNTTSIGGSNVYIKSDDDLIREQVALKGLSMVTPDDYDMLKEAGVNIKDDSNTVLNKLYKYQSEQAIRSTNFTPQNINYDNLNTSIIQQLAAIPEDTSLDITVLDSKGKPTSKKITGSDASKEIAGKIINTSIDPNNPRKLILHTGKKESDGTFTKYKDYSVDPRLLSSRIGNLMDTYASYIEEAKNDKDYESMSYLITGDKKTPGMIQKLSVLMADLFNQVQGETTSKFEIE